MNVHSSKKEKYFLTLLIFLLISMGTTHAEKVVLNTFAPKEVLVGEEFDLVYALENALDDAKDVKFEGPKSIDGFKIIAGPVRSERVHYEIKQNVKREEIIVQYSYTLEAKEQGDFKFPMATINVGGEKVKSQELLVKVLSTDDLENEISFTVKTIPDEIVKGKEFRVNYVLENAVGKDFKGPTSIKDMEILFGPSRSTSTNVEVVNGVTTRNYTEVYSYVLKTDYPAVYTLPIATVVANGKTLTSDQIRIKVATSPNAPIESQNTDQNLRSKNNSATNIFEGFAVFVLCSIIPFIFMVVGLAIMFVGISKKKKNLKLAGIVVAVMALQIILIFLFVFGISFFEKVILS